MTERDCRLHQVIRGWTWLAAARVGSPGNKPIIVESDHAGSNKDAAWVWQMSTRGYSVAIMDDKSFPDPNDSVWAKAAVSATKSSALVLLSRGMSPRC